MNSSKLRLPKVFESDELAGRIQERPNESVKWPGSALREAPLLVPRNLHDERYICRNTSLTSMVHTAGKANTQFMIPKPIEASKAFRSPSNWFLNALESMSEE